MNEIRCVRCGRERPSRGRLNPELHRVLYLCDDLCQDCTDELHEWWMLPAGSYMRAAEYASTRSHDNMDPPRLTSRYRENHRRPVRRTRPV